MDPRDYPDDVRVKTEPVDEDIDYSREFPYLGAGPEENSSFLHYRGSSQDWRQMAAQDLFVAENYLNQYPLDFDNLLPEERQFLGVVNNMEPPPLEDEEQASGFFKKTLDVLGKVFKFVGKGVFYLSLATVIHKLFTGTNIPAVSSLARLNSYGIDRGTDWVREHILPSTPLEIADPSSIEKPSFTDQSTYEQHYNAALADPNSIYASPYQTYGRLSSVISHLEQAVASFKEIYDENPIDKNRDILNQAQRKLDLFKALRAMAEQTGVAGEKKYDLPEDVHLQQKINLLTSGTPFPLVNVERGKIDYRQLPSFVTAARLASSAYAPDFDRASELDNYIPIYDYTRKPVPADVGFIAYDKAMETVVVSFAGTSNSADVRADLDLAFSKELSKLERGSARNKDDREIVELGMPLEAGKGAVQRLENIAPEFLQNFETFMQKYPTAPVIVTGHSLGGAMATLTALVLKQLYPDREILFYAFEPPRVFSSKMASKMLEDPTLASTILYSIRTTNPRDPVTALPPRWMDAVHVGNTWEIQNPSGYVVDAHRMEHVTDDIKNYIENPKKYPIVPTSGSGVIRPRKRLRKH